MRTTLLLCLLLSLGMASTARAEGLPWIASDKEAFAQAHTAGKPVLLYLHADYCVWCRVMEQTTFQDSRVRLLASQYVLCKLNGDREGKSYLQKFQVEKYPFHAVLDASGALVAQAPDYMDADKYVHVLAASLPANVLTSLENDRTAHPGDPQTLALLTVIHAERSETEAASRTLTALADGVVPPPAALLAAASHALGLAYSVRGEDSQAIPCLQTAASAATDAREAVALRFLLVSSWMLLHKKADALAELATIRHFPAATKDEKQDAQKQEKILTASQN